MHFCILSLIFETAHVTVAGAFCGSVIRVVVSVTMVAKLSQRLWCMQRVQKFVHGVKFGFNGLWAPNSPATSSAASPLTGVRQASVRADAILQASSAAYMSPHNMRQSMVQWFMSGGPPSVLRLPSLHGTAGYSSPAMQQNGAAGGNGNVCAAVPDQDLASGTEPEVFEEADAVMQPDLQHTEAPLQVHAAASHVHWH